MLKAWVGVVVGVVWSRRWWEVGAGFEVPVYAGLYGCSVEVDRGGVPGGIC